VSFKIPKPPREPALKVSGDPLREFVGGADWARWPSAWTTGTAAGLRVPAAGAWTGPEGLGKVLANLATMRKRLEQFHALALKAGGLAHVYAGYRKTGTLTQVQIQGLKLVTPDEFAAGGTVAA
jgi:hypothetical protein